MAQRPEDDRGPQTPADGASDADVRPARPVSTIDEAADLIRDYVIEFWNHANDHHHGYRLRWPIKRVSKLEPGTQVTFQQIEHQEPDGEPPVVIAGWYNGPNDGKGSVLFGSLPDGTPLEVEAVIPGPNTGSRPEVYVVTGDRRNSVETVLSDFGPRYFESHIRPYLPIPPSRLVRAERPAVMPQPRQRRRSS